MRHLALAAAIVLAAPALTAAQTFDADRNARITVSPQGVQGGGSSESGPATDPTVRRSVQQGVGSGGGASNAAPVNRGAPSGLLNQIPSRAVPNEANPR